MTIVNCEKPKIAWHRLLLRRLHLWNTFQAKKPEESKITWRVRLQTLTELSSYLFER